MKAKRIWITAAVCAAAALALCTAFFLMHLSRSFAAAPPVSAPVSRSMPAAAASTLFPELTDMPVTALFVSTPDRSFQFHKDKQGMVSVNGHQADSEVFSTLLDQIAELPAERRSAFDPRPQDLILTLVISSDQKQQTVRFYEDAASSETAHIVLGAGDLSEYLQTSTWRVGTLMMTCEGTRILDIHGNETPVIPAAKPD